MIYAANDNIKATSLSDILKHIHSGNNKPIDIIEIIGGSNE